MGICRDISECQVDFVKEMAEGLGCTGLLLDSLLAKIRSAEADTAKMIDEYRSLSAKESIDFAHQINENIREYNSLIDKAEDALRWLLIQREACGFRTHKNVDIFYPIPPKMKLVGH